MCPRALAWTIGGIADALSSSLYAALLGPAWATLAPEVRALHAGGAEARGRFRVLHGAGWLARVLARVLRMPPASDGIDVTLLVERLRGGERWTRWFGDRRLRSLQWSRRGQLVEGYGGVQCVFRLEAEGGALVFRQVGARVGLRAVALPLPRWLAPRVQGRASPGDDGVRVDIRIHAPLLGLIVAYEGCVAPAGVAAHPPAAEAAT